MKPTLIVGLGNPLMGADGIISVRFDSSEIGQQFTEIVAYGTAVKLAPAG